MRITVELPDDLALHPNGGREALVIEGYRSTKLSHYEAAQLPGLTRFAFDDFLKTRQIDDHAFSSEDFERDLVTIRKLEEQGLLRRS